MLSRPWRQRKKEYDFVVVGSGYGGAITAARIATAHLRPAPSICILERGREWRIGEFPDTMGGVLAEFRNRRHPLGLYEMLRYPDLSVLKGCGLGGTSLINSNIAAVPDPEVFEQPEWPRSLTLGALEPYLQRVLRVLGAQPDPRAWSFGKVEGIDRRAREMGKRATLMDLTINHAPWHFNRHGMLQRPCLGCGDCTTGCNHHSKNTLYMNYLPMARNAGADIFTEREARWIEKRPGGGWRVHGRRYDAGLLDSRFQLDAAHVILAAGSVHSTEILLRSQLHGLSLSPAVGTRFSCNGDFWGISYNGDYPIGAIGFGNHPSSPVAQTPPGPAIVSAIHYDSELPLKRRIHIEDYSIPSAYVRAAKKAFALLRAGEDTDTGDETVEMIRRRRDLDLLDTYQPEGALNHTMVYMVMGFDDARGKMILENKRGSVEIVWDDAGRQPLYTRLNEELRRHARAQGGSFVSNPLWDLFEMRHVMTAHPLGGCPLGEDPAASAVDEFGRVFSGSGELHDGLFVADGAIVPSSVGINPFLTISALAERIAERKIRALAGDPYPARAPVLSVDLAGGEVCDADESGLERLFARRAGGGAAALPGAGEPEFDVAAREMRGGRGWRGVFPRDHLLSATSAPLFEGFRREFRREGGRLVGVTTSLDGGIEVRHELEELEVEQRTRELEPGRYLLSRPVDAPEAYEVLKIVRDDLVIGRAYAGEYPQGKRLYTFGLSRRCGFEQMTQQDHRALWERGAAPSPEELKGTWRLDSISPHGGPSGLAYLRFELEEGRLTSHLRPLGLLEGLLVPAALEAHFQGRDFTAQDEIRRLDRNSMIGRCTIEGDAGPAEALSTLGVLQRQEGRWCCGYCLSRVDGTGDPPRTALSPYSKVQLPDGVGLEIEEDLAGWLLPGPLPASLDRSGSRPAGSVDCRLRVRLEVRDLNEFVEGAAHEGGVSGELVVAGLEGEADLTLEVDPQRSVFDFRPLGPDFREASIRYRLRLTAGSERRFRLEGFQSLRNDAGGAWSRGEMLDDYTTLYGCLSETRSEAKEIGSIFLRSAAAAALAMPGNLEGVIRDWRVTGTRDRLLQRYAKMRYLAFAARFLAAGPPIPASTTGP